MADPKTPETVVPKIVAPKIEAPDSQAPELEAPTRPKPWFPPKLTTDRLLLRAVTHRDIEGIFAYASNPAVARYTLWTPHTDLETSLAFVKDFAYANYQAEVPDPFAITLKESSERVIGTVGCSWVSEHHHTMELGFALAEEHWGQGLVLEAAWAVLCFAFSLYPVHRIQARCHVDHKRSARVLEKLGMSYEGQLRSAVRLGEDYWDLDIYAILQPEWQQRVEDLTP
ncbi:MAG: GNAT family N-acetyltransferase [Deltaproteobacteria bacterium]|nr:GNAT family N-acetyltransferase [Deltaproteobacteria bacterium]